MILLGTIIAGSTMYIVNSVYEQRAHKRNMELAFKHRIHVNGIRGKSSVTRLIAAALREANIKTLAKTTGTAARVITSNHRESHIVRKEANIAEQKKILDLYVGSGYKAIVFECMAINPIYQAYLEDKIMYSTIGVITNVREDHTDLMGKTLPEIAKSLSATVPTNGHLVTAENDPELLAILQDVCKQKNTTMHAVGKMRIGERHMAKFKHFEYKSNVAIAIKVAELVGISRAKALKGMHKAMPDPGAFVLKKIEKDNKVIHWANLFAINDRESFIFTTDILAGKISGKAKKAIILNNRTDRPERVSQFVDVAVNQVGADYIFTFGDYESHVANEMKKYKNKKVTVINMGNSTEYRSASGRKLFDAIVDSVDEKECLLVGAVNIHTEQSQALLKVLEKRNTYHAH